MTREEFVAYVVREKGLDAAKVERSLDFRAEFFAKSGGADGASFRTAAPLVSPLTTAYAACASPIGVSARPLSRAFAWFQRS